MNINNFEDHINKKILDRGYDYYIEGNILETYKQGNKEYLFQIEGNKVYEVTVKIDDKGEIIYSECDCPYDLGPICKHQVAAYYELSEILDSSVDDFGVKNEVVGQPEIKEVLNSLSKEELIRIIADISQKDAALKNSLIVRYSKGNDEQELEKCKRLIESIVRKYTGREGFIKYRETYGFAN